MGIEEVERIKKIFLNLNISPNYLQHEEVITSEEAAKTRGFDLRQGIKALLFTNGENFVIINVPADQRVDKKKVAKNRGWSNSKARMAKVEEVEEQTGCLIGSVPPFGHKEKIHLLVDQSIFENQISTFNIGLRTESVSLPTEKMKEVFASENAELGEFIQ